MKVQVLATLATNYAAFSQLPLQTSFILYNRRENQFGRLIDLAETLCKTSPTKALKENGGQKTVKPDALVVTVINNRK